MIGGLFANLVDILMDSSYATGGEVLGGNECGVPSLLAVIDTQSGVGDGGYKFKYNVATGKLQVFRGAGVPISVYAESDIKGSANTDAVGAGAYITIPTNGALISSLAAADNTTAFTIALQPDIPRNVSILIKDATGGNTDGLAASYVIVGTFRGAAQTETISFTVLNLTTMSNGNIAIKYGSKPFDSITSITPSAAQPTGFQHGVGPGSKLGLPTATATNAEADLVKLTKNAADLAVTGLYSTNQTVNFGTLADGDDVSVEYNVAGGQEVASGFDLSAVTIRALAVG
jgi:hypothetical protein